MEWDISTFESGCSPLTSAWTAECHPDLWFDGSTLGAQTEAPPDLRGARLAWHLRWSCGTSCLCQRDGWWCEKLIRPVRVYASLKMTCALFHAVTSTLFLSHSNCSQAPFKEILESGPLLLSKSHQSKIRKDHFKVKAALNSSALSHPHVNMFNSLNCSPSPCTRQIVCDLQRAAAAFYHPTCSSLFSHGFLLRLLWSTNCGLWSRNGS